MKSSRLMLLNQVTKVAVNSIKLIDQSRPPT